MDSSIEHEIKFTCSNQRAVYLLDWLRAQLLPDPLYPVGVVASIYYDTVDWRFLGEKVNSDYLKTKFRVRWYSVDPLSEPIEGSGFAEVKQKTGAHRNKYRLRLPQSTLWLAHTSLSDIGLYDLPAFALSKGIFVQPGLIPTLEVRYERYRFVEPSTHTRVCLDLNINAPRFNDHMIPDGQPAVLSTAVFEAKGNHNQIPRSLYSITDYGFKKTSFSKYSACYQNIRGVHF